MDPRRNPWMALVATLLLLSPLIVFAQQKEPKKPARIGFLGASSSSSYATRTDALRAGLRELGYVEGRNLTFEWKFADGSPERVASLAAELVRSKVDVIIAASPPSVQAAQRATQTIPVVMVAVGDPVGSGFVASLSQPGANITGLSNMNVDLSIKYLELLRAAIPRSARIGALFNPDQPEHPVFLQKLRAAAGIASVTVFPREARTEKEVGAAIEALGRERVDAFIVFPAPLFLINRSHIAEMAVRLRMPTMWWTREAVESGGLMSYGQNPVEHFQRAGLYVDKILRGAAPAALPVEQASRLELIINLRTAKALGMTMPKELLLRADTILQ